MDKNSPAGDTGLLPGPEDPTCHGATKPMCPNHWTCVLEPRNHNYWACMLKLLNPTSSRGPQPQLLESTCVKSAPQQEKPPQWEAYAPQLESSPHVSQLEKAAQSTEHPGQPKINKWNKEELRNNLSKEHDHFKFSFCDIWFIPVVCVCVYVFFKSYTIFL